MIGKTISHYKILGKLGEGGMGKVYLAEDLKLKRSIALKFLPTHLTSDSEAVQRFEREAQTAAALNHPNIVTIYEVSYFSNQIFIAMEYVDGISLRKKISDSSFQIEQKVEIIIQICEGLKKIHQTGIIHRDIKPENILIDGDGVVKILDFGLSVLKGVSRLTKNKSTLGTIHYMSPEQARGDEVDQRTDIWSLGILIYEMLTGHLPFTGEYETAYIYSLLNEEPKALSSFREDMPANLIQIVEKSLNKDPEKRFQSISEIIYELKMPALALTITQEKKKAIIVLPFVNMSPDPNQEYFSDGLTEEIITDLSMINDLQVISRNSAMTFKGTKKKTSEISKEVNARYILEGSVRKSGENLRITAQLIEATTDVHLWAEKYSGTLDDVFDIQENVSRSIVDALKVRLTPHENQGMSKRVVDNLQVYECYLKSREEFWKWSEEGLERAIQIIHNGLQILGEHELFYVALGTVYAQYIHFGIKKEEGYLLKAEECIDKIFTFNPESSHGHYLKGFTQWWRGRAKEAVQELKKALAINPNLSDAMIWLAWIYAISGKGFAAHPLFKNALEIDLLNFSVYGHFSASQMLEGKFAKAQEIWSTGYHMNPKNPWFRIWYAFLFAYDNRIEEANKYIDLLVIDTPQSIWAQLGTFLKYALNHNKMKAMKSVSEELETAMKWNELYPLFMADCYSLVNENEKAIDWLEEGIRCGCSNYPFLNSYDPFLENIRGDKRFKELMNMVKYKWENFEI